MKKLLIVLLLVSFMVGAKTITDEVKEKWTKFLEEQETRRLERTE